MVEFLTSVSEVLVPRRARKEGEKEGDDLCHSRVDAYVYDGLPFVSSNQR